MSDPDAWPTREEDATAERMCRALVRRANRRAEVIIELCATTEGVTSPRYHAELAAMNCEYVIIQSLRGMAAEWPEAADGAARQMYEDWADGQHVMEMLGEWAAEYARPTVEETEK